MAELNGGGGGGGGFLFPVHYRGILDPVQNRVKCIYQLPPNLARVHDLVHSFAVSHKDFKFSILPIVSILFFCSSVNRLSFLL